VEWDKYKRALQASSISILDSIDELTWTGGDSIRNFTTKNVYEAIISILNFQNIKNWHKRIWKGNIQLKIKLFLWLTVENNILTWKILQQRGWLGPGLCHFCKISCEDNAHLFIQCNFTKSIWQKISSIKNIRDKWEGVNLDACLTIWMENKTNLASLVSLIV